MSKTDVVFFWFKLEFTLLNNKYLLVYNYLLFITTAEKLKKPNFFDNHILCFGVKSKHFTMKTNIQ